MTKKNDTWMPLYIGDYLADTSRLSTEQHGAYLLLLMDYWRNGPPLDDDEELANITKLPLPQWRKHAAKLRAMFECVDGRLVQRRAEKEREKAGMVSGKRSQAGKAGAEARWGKKPGKTDGKSMANAMANASQNDGPSHSHSEAIETEDCTRHGAGRAEDPPEGRAPTRAGLLCCKLGKAGIANRNPGHAGLQVLLEAGATDDEFLGLAPQALGKRDPFGWLLGAVAGQRQDAAQLAKGLHRGPMNAPLRTPTAAEQRVLQACPELAAPHLRPVATPSPFIDNEVPRAPPRILG